MKIIAIFHLKGGVGKTATAVNLAYLASLTGAPTLLMDLDPQGASTFYYRIKPKLEAGVKLLTKGKKTLQRHIRATDFEDLDVLPSDESLRQSDKLFLKSDQPREILRRFFKPLAKHYEYLILDCPPTLSMITENIFTAADWVLTPVVPTTLAVRTHEQLANFLDRKRWSNLQWFSFLSMVDNRKAMHREIAAKLKKQEDHFLQSTIPYLSDVEKMGTYRLPLPCFAPHSDATKAYRRLWWELEKRIS